MLRPLVQMGATRWETAAEVPTLRELGFDVVEGSMRGMAAPAGLPAPVLARLALSIRRTVDNPESFPLAHERVRKQQVLCRFFCSLFDTPFSVILQNKPNIFLPPLAFLRKKDRVRDYLLCHFSITTRSGEAMKTEEYVPAITPTESASANWRVGSPPKK